MHTRVTSVSASGHCTRLSIVAYTTKSYAKGIKARIGIMPASEKIANKSVMAESVYIVMFNSQQLKASYSLKANSSRNNFLGTVSVIHDVEYYIIYLSIYSIF